MAGGGGGRFSLKLEGGYPRRWGGGRVAARMSARGGGGICVG